MKRKFSFKKSLKNFTPVMAIAVVGVLTLVITAGAVGYDKIFNVTNYYEASSEGNLGGQVHNTQETFDAGIAVNGTEIINSSGVFTGTVEGTIATSATAIVGALTDYGALTAEAITGSSTLTISAESQLQRVIQGGTVAASTTDASVTLTAAEICDNSVVGKTISVNPGTAITVTLPATSTLAADCLDTVGDTVSFLYSNDSTKVASTTTITTNTDYDMLSDDANGDVIAGLDSAIITITREATKMIAIINPFTSAE